MVRYVRIGRQQVAAVPPPYRPLPPTEADRAKAREVIEEVFGDAVWDEGYLTDAAIEPLATAIAQARQEARIPATHYVKVTPEQVAAAKREVAALEAAGLTPDPMVVKLANAREEEPKR